MDTPKDIVIIGSGLSGLSAAHFLKKFTPFLNVRLLEMTNRPGGAIQTYKKDGFQGEWGPHGFLDNSAESQELIHDIGLYEKAQQAPLGDFFRYLCHKGKLVALPQSPKTVFKTPLVSMRGKLRALADLWRRPILNDQTLEEWVAYRFGKELLPLVDAAVSGSFAGDYTKLSIDSIMPGVRGLEKEFGSVLRGLIKKKKAAKGNKLGRLPSMLNFPEGMEYLISTLAKDKDIHFQNVVKGVTLQDKWHLNTEKGDIDADIVIFALPINQTLKLLSGFKQPPVASVPVSRIVNVVMGLNDSAKVPYGFGYLAPEIEKRFTMGAMFTSHMFPDRSPKGKVLIEALVGGRRHPERLTLSDDELVQKVSADVGQLIDIPEPPLLNRVLRSEHGIPQMEMDHPALLSWRHDMEREFSGLHICGFGWDGIGMNDMIKSAHKTALAIKDGGGRKEEDAKVKPVYF